MISDESIKGLWCVKYAPKVLEDLIISEEVRAKLLEFKSNDSIPNLLFVGNPGCGKSTTAKIIVNDLLKCDYLYINASDENGIDTIRMKVSNFAQTKSFDGRIKVVILEEADFITPQAQGALRNTMESFAQYTRFILTANYKHKIIPAIQSRCQLIDIKPTLKEAAVRCLDICRSENITIPSNKQFLELIRNCFPDLRKTINELQKSCINGVLQISSEQTNNAFIGKIFEYLQDNNSLGLRKYLIENESQFADYDQLLQDTLEFVYVSDFQDVVKKQIIAVIADALYKSVFVLDKEINAFACWLVIEQILNP